MTDRDALRTALAEVQHYSLTVEPDDSAYMELDRDGQYVLIEDVDAVAAALAASEPAGLDVERLAQSIYAVRDWGGMTEVRKFAAKVAREYAALAATPTASPTADAEAQA